MRQVAIYVLLLLQSVVFLTVSHAQPERSDGPIILTLPAEWVPFSADVLNISNSNVVTGKFHRRRDGSTAYYLDTQAGPAITIHNLQTRQTYVKLGERDWMARPLEERALDGPPPELRLPKRQVQVFLDADLGEIYEFTNGRGGGVTRLAPRLNAFRVSYHLPNGVSSEYRNIRIGDQPDQLFVPPPDARVQ